MMTWWVKAYGDIFLVTAEDVAMARLWLKREHGIDVENAELINVKTSSRCGNCKLPTLTQEKVR